MADVTNERVLAEIKGLRQDIHKTALNGHTAALVDLLKHKDGLIKVAVCSDDLIAAARLLPEIKESVALLPSLAEIVTERNRRIALHNLLRSVFRRPMSLGHFLATTLATGLLTAATYWLVVIHWAHH